ncbi:hypothetical protein FHK92_19585 [Pseudomonas brassicacearum subsp. neoaurantiaca]|uniref:Uncharacterized protein n=1 Tax=Pseudomonas brassicacearum subsp. neoaurantiaca TaxID=494916 RepID=A0A7V8UEB3_9PSED|nr:hypothetical protein [Pseudomonas brassicacearum subsp. neoaurantiaca]
MGAGLLAKGPGQATLMVAGVPLSRASSLPQFFSVFGLLVAEHALAPALVARELAPAGLRSGPKSCSAVGQVD